MTLTDEDMDKLGGLMRWTPVRVVRIAPKIAKRRRIGCSFHMREVDPAWQSLADRGLVRVDHIPGFCPGRIGPYHVGLTGAGVTAFKAQWTKEYQAACVRAASRSALADGGSDASI